MIKKMGEILVGSMLGILALGVLVLGSIFELVELPRYLRIRRM